MERMGNRDLQMCNRSAGPVVRAGILEGIQQSQVRFSITVPSCRHLAEQDGRLSLIFLFGHACEYQIAATGNHLVGDSTEQI
ncbi:MAG TPA: hypothetical protein VKQ27_07515 [Acetobacteraceae bacterium]|nr:hypothetical protein [Acetobacteraceae bacterium]